MSDLVILKEEIEKRLEALGWWKDLFVEEGRLEMLEQLSSLLDEVLGKTS